MIQFMLLLLWGKSDYLVYYGKAKAPHELMYYFDIGCAHCIDFYSKVLPVLKKRFCDTGHLRIICHPYPIHLETVIFMACCDVLNAQEKQILFETLMELKVPTVESINTCMKVLKKPNTGPTVSALQAALLITERHNFVTLPVMFFNKKRLTDAQQDDLIPFLEHQNLQTARKD